MASSEVNSIYLAVRTRDSTGIRFEHVHGPVDDPVEYDLEITRMGTYQAKDLARGGLQLK